MWADLLINKHFYLRGRICKVQNGRDTLFWTDVRREGVPLCTKCSLTKKGDLKFRRWLPSIFFIQWTHLCGEILASPLKEREDKWEWKKGKHGMLSVKIVYDQLSGPGNGVNFSYI